MDEIWGTLYQETTTGGYTSCCFLLMVVSAKSVKSTIWNLYNLCVQLYIYNIYSKYMNRHQSRFVQVVWRIVLEGRMVLGPWC